MYMPGRTNASLLMQKILNIPTVTVLVTKEQVHL